VNIADTIDGARRAFEIAGRGCLVRLGEDEPRYATVAEIAARLEPYDRVRPVCDDAAAEYRRSGPDGGMRSPLNSVSLGGVTRTGLHYVMKETL
jgi:hypothetical protein